MDDPLHLTEGKWELERLDLPPAFCAIAPHHIFVSANPVQPVIMLLRKLHEAGSPND